MNERHHDLIWALLDGTLDKSEAAAAEAEIATDLESVAELAAQRSTRAALRAAPPAELTEVERAYLHRHVAGVLGLETQPTRSRRRYRFQFSWSKLAPVAAVFLAFAIGFPLVGTYLSNRADTDTLAEPAATSLAPASAESGTAHEDDARFAASPTTEALVTAATTTTAASATTSKANDLTQGAGTSGDGGESVDTVLPYFGAIDDDALTALVAVVARGPDATASAAETVRPLPAAAVCDIDPGYGVGGTPGSAVFLLNYQAHEAVAFSYEDTLVVFSLPECIPVVAAGPEGILTP